MHSDAEQDGAGLHRNIAHKSQLTNDQSCQLGFPGSCAKQRQRPGNLVQYNEATVSYLLASLTTKSPSPRPAEF